MKDYSIKKEWITYYKTLEYIRRSGIVNMFGAAPYLAQVCDIDERLAKNILVNWMHNYNELSEEFGWRD